MEVNNEEIEKFFVNERNLTILRLIGYVSLLFTTGIVGFGILSKTGLKQKHIEIIKNIVTSVLMFSWFIFLISESIGLRQLNSELVDIN